MSVKHLALAADITGVTPACKLLLFGLCISADERGRSTASNLELQQATCLSERAVRSNLRKLEALRFIQEAEKPWRYVIASWNMPVTL